MSTFNNFDQIKKKKKRSLIIFGRHLLFEKKRLDMNEKT